MWNLGIELLVIRPEGQAPVPAKPSSLLFATWNWESSYLVSDFGFVAQAGLGLVSCLTF